MVTRWLKNRVCIAYIDIDGEYVEEWHESKDHLKRWLRLMGPSRDVFEYFESMGIKAKNLMLITRSTVADYFDYNLHPHESRTVIEMFILENLTLPGRCQERATEPLGQ